MARQDIYGTIEDDLGHDGHTSSCKGKVKRVSVKINTDTVGHMTGHFSYDKERGTVVGWLQIPPSWIVETKRTEL